MFFMFCPHQAPLPHCPLLPVLWRSLPFSGRHQTFYIQSSTQQVLSGRVQWLQVHRFWSYCCFRHCLTSATHPSLKWLEVACYHMAVCKIRSQPLIYKSGDIINKGIYLLIDTFIDRFSRTMSVLSLCLTLHSFHCRKMKPKYLGHERWWHHL